MAEKQTPVELLAKSLGYKDVKEMKANLGAQAGESGKKGKNIKEKGSLISRLESGQGFKEAIGGSVKEKLTSLKESYGSKEAIKKTVKGKAKDVGKTMFNSFFSGNNVFSAYARGRLNKGGDKKEGEESSPEEGGESGGAGGLDLVETNTLLKIIAKNSTSLHLMSRDMNVMRQNVVKMVKIENNKARGGKKKKKGEKDAHEAATRADTWFMREDEREAKLESEQEKFKPKDTTPTPAPAPEKKEEEGGGFIDSIISMLTSGLMSGLSAILNPGVILKLLGRVFVIGTILISLFQGIMAGWEKWKETGDLWEAIKAGLVAIIDFLTFGLFGEDNIKKMFKAVEDFVKPIIDAVKDVINGIKDWVANNVGVPEISIPVPKFLQKLGAPEKISIGPWYPFKDDPTSSKDQVTKSAAESRQEDEAKAAAATGGATESEKQPSAESKSLTVKQGDEGDVTNNFNALQKSAGELKDLKAQYMRERIALDASGLKPGTPEYDEQKDALVQKYQPLIDEKKKEIDTYASKPGVKEMAKTNGVDLSGIGISLKDEESPTPAPTTAPTASATSPSPAPAAGGEPTKTSPTPSGGGDVAPSAEGIKSPDEKGAAASGGESSTPSPAPTASEAAPAASAAVAPASDVTPPTEDTTPAPMSDTGSALSEQSSDVAEAQRMESAADVGSTINAPSSTTNQATASEGKPPISSAWDNVFLNFYAAT